MPAARSYSRYHALREGLFEKVQSMSRTMSWYGLAGSQLLTLTFNQPIHNSLTNFMSSTWAVTLGFARCQQVKTFIPAWLCQLCVIFSLSSCTSRQHCVDVWHPRPGKRTV